jgi:hypothetical protein
MKSFIVLIVCISALSYSNAQVHYEGFFLINELKVYAESNNSEYYMYQFAPNFFTTTMVNAFYDFEQKRFFNPDSQLQSLGCDRKLHVTNWGYMYCVDDVSNYLYQISVEQPFTVVNKWWLGYTEESYFDWSDLATQYLIFCDVGPSPQNSEQVNFTAFNMETQTWVTSFEFQPGELGGENYQIEGYFVSTDFIGWALEDSKSKNGVQYWTYNFQSQTYNKFA